MHESFSGLRKEVTLPPAAEILPERDKDVEAKAEAELESLLRDPDNKFLTEVPQNRIVIEDAPTAVEALEFARRKIEERYQRTFHFENVVSIEGIEPREIHYQGMKETVHRILRGSREIGRGKDGYVVIDRNEIRMVPPEVCYKFSSHDRVRRGQNTTFEEVDYQGKFYEVALEAKTDIGVPIPFYALEIGDRQMIAMEKLNAASLEDILIKRRGELPAWIEVDAFCDALKATIDAFHRQNLFHRDIHFGNIMVSQSELRGPGEKAGYIIDFGVSGHGIEGMDPYKKEVAGKTFTYDNDYGIIEQVRKQMHAYRRRQYDAAE